MALVLKLSVDPAEVWLPLFRDTPPELDVRVWPEIGNPQGIEFVLLRRPEPGLLAKMPNLRWICSIPAEVDARS